MTQLSTILSELLFERDLVIVPGLGAFARHDDAAKVNVITNQFERPSSSIRFLPQQREENDLLAKAVAAYEGCQLEEGRARVAQFVSDCFAEFKEGREVVLPGIGTLSMDGTQTICFAPDDSENYNSDAFGLGDFSMTPVFDGKAADDWRAQVLKQNKDKNTPMTVDRKAMEEDLNDEVGYRRRRRRAVLFSLLTLLLAIPAVLLLLVFLEVIHIDFPTRPKPLPPTQVVHLPDSALQSQLVCYYIPPQIPDEPLPSADTLLFADTIVLVENLEISDTIVTTDSVVTDNVNPSVEAVPVAEPEPEQPVGKIFIIGGCFAQQENAEKLAASIREQGFENAFVMQRGRMYYVSYGRFVTMEEANVELARIRVYSNNKAWILNK
ncbi:MAG: SPOR domain-containing protein [Bacteroidales bacterium]|nr:SPOR domain-containing protein [Bacteroidales bacterium]